MISSNWIFLGSLVILGAAPTAIAQSFQDAALSGAGAGDMQLSEVLAKEGQGLDREDPTYRHLIQEKAKLFSSFIKGNDRRVRSESEIPGCHSGSHYHLFCEIPLSIFRASPVPKSVRRALWKRQRQWRVLVRDWIRKGDAVKFKDLSFEEIQRSLQLVSQPDDLLALEEKLDALPACQIPALDLLIAAKLEEFFPDQNSIRKSTRRYERVVSCENGDLAEKATYRLSMIQLLDQRCDAARPYLERLSYLKPSKDYSSRTLYWLSWCEAQAGNQVAFEKARKTLLEGYPFSLHSLLLQSQEANRDGNQDFNPAKTQVLMPDSRVKFRSVRHPEFNTRVAAAEGLVSIRELDMARKILVSLAGDLEDTEPEFQLYVATLLNRMRDNLSKFKVLGLLFRSHPEMISRAALELYYPHHALNFFASNQKKTDQFLILSLIRQESAFNEKARSTSGALGLMQLLPRTARKIERVVARQLYNPMINVRIGTKYISGLIQRYQGDVELALAAYNAGTARVEDWEKRYPVQSRLLFIDLIPFKETREYVSSIARNYYWYNLLYSQPSSKRESSFRLFGT